MFTNTLEEVSVALKGTLGKPPLPPSNNLSPNLRGLTFAADEVIFEDRPNAVPVLWQSPVPRDASSMLALNVLLTYITSLPDDYVFPSSGFVWKISRLKKLCLRIWPCWQQAFTMTILPHLPDPAMLSDMHHICTFLSKPFGKVGDDMAVWCPKHRPGMWSHSVRQFEQACPGILPPSRKGLSQLINARAQEITETAINHIVLNVRARVQSFAFWSLRKLGVPTNEQPALAYSVVDALFAKQYKEEPTLHPWAEAVFSEIKHACAAIPVASWSPENGILPLKDYQGFADQKLFPAYLYLFRFFEESYRTDPAFTLLPQELPYSSDRFSFSRKEHEAQIHENVVPRTKTKTKFMHFSLFPLPSFQGCFIEVDKLALHEWISTFPERERLRFRTYDKNADANTKLELVSEIFLFPETRTRQPHPEAGVKTDGQSLRLVMMDMMRSPPQKKPPNAAQRQEKDMADAQTLLEQHGSLEVIGIDPGIKCPITSVNVSRHRQGRSSLLYRSWKITSGHYHQLTWSIRHWHLKHQRLKDRRGRDKPICKVFAQIPSGRTTISVHFMKLVRYVLPHLQNAVHFSCAPRVKSWRFRALRRRQSALSHVVTRILCDCINPKTCKCNIHALRARRSNVVVAYGAAKFNPSMRGNAPAPNARIARGLERLVGVKVAYVDEFRTSKLCCTCHNELAPLQSTNHAESLPQVPIQPPQAPRQHGYHGTLQCTNYNCRAHGKPWNRDVNAAINMASLFLYNLDNGHQARPSSFKRASLLGPPSSPPTFSWFVARQLTPPSAL